MLYRYIAAALLAAVLVLSNADKEEAVEPPETYGAEGYWVLATMKQPTMTPTPMPTATPVVSYPPASYYQEGVEQWRSLVSKYDWNVETMLYIISRESRGNPTVVSHTNDWGLCQVNWPSHYDKVQRRFGVADPNLLLVPENNIAICYDIYVAYGKTYGAWRWYGG